MDSSELIFEFDENLTARCQNVTVTLGRGVAQGLDTEDWSKSVGPRIKWSIAIRNRAKSRKLR